MDVFETCKRIYEAVRYFTYGIPVDGVIKSVPTAEYFDENYRFLSPQEFVDLEGGVCWDYVEYERTCCENHGLKYHQYYIITDTPPNYDTHTFITVEDGDELIYIESSFKKVEHIIDGVKKFKSLEEIVNLITTTMFSCNGNDKRFDEFKYDVMEYHGHPAYGCTCEEYMNWMNENAEMVIQDTAVNPKNIDTDELNVESVDILQEGLFNFGKPKEPVDVMAKLTETFGELSPAQSDIINRPTNDHNPMGKFDFFVTPYSKYYYDMTIRARKLDSFLKKESVLIGSVIGVPEGSIPIGRIDIIPNIDNVIKNYEAYEDGQLEYEDYYELYMDDPRYGLAKVRVYADQNGAIYTCLSQDGKYTQVAKSYDEFVSKFNTYKFKLNKNEFTVSRRYSSRDGFDVFSVGLNTGDAEYTTTYKIDSNDIHTVALLYARFISFATTQIFDLDADGDDEPTDFPVEYESYKQIETACAEHGVDKPFYPKMKVVELTFHKAPEPTESYFVPSKLTYVFALNESLDKPFMTAEVESGKVMSVKFNDSAIKEYVDPEEYDETIHDHIDDEDDIYNESWTDFKNGVHPSSGLMFHVSLKNDMDGKTINPQLPSYITDGGELDDNYQEDTKTKRLCVSPSIEGCLIAILNYNKIREHVGDKFYVYTPEKPFSQYKHKTNKEIVKDKLVFDANITKEAWILEPCKLKLYGIIKLKKVKDLKKKPTVEKNIKMNTIKLDYEWIMTPKASGKFNKAIGDSPDKEDDKKEKPINEYDNILVSNEEFFMEASKNPDIKARKRTVKNLRKLGVDRAHEVDNKREIDKLERQLADLKKKYDNKEISYGEGLEQELFLKNQIRSLKKGVDINITDSYGNKHKTRLTSDKDETDSYNIMRNKINITPKTMNSNNFDTTFDHESGHTEQHKRFGFNNLDTQDYAVSDKDDYPIKCAKLFLQRNKDKMNSHDVNWTELHADFLAAKKSGVNKRMKDIHSFKLSKEKIDALIDQCIKYNEAFCKKLDNRYLKLKDEDGNERTLTQKDIDECVSLYNQAKEKLEKYHTILVERFNELLKKMFDEKSSKSYKEKLDKLLRKLEHRKVEISDKMLTLENDFKYNGIPATNALNYDFAMKNQIREYNDELKDLNAEFTTHDYRIKFLEDMKHIHEGHPGRCSMKYPPMTPEDKKYMMEYESDLVSNNEFFMESHKLERRISVRPESLSEKLYIGIHPSFINTKCKIDDKSLKTLSRFLNSGREIYLTKYPVVAYAWTLDKYFTSKAKKKKLWDYVATLSEEELTNEEFDAFDICHDKLLYTFKGYVLKIDRDDIVDISQVYRYPEMQHPSMVLVDSLNLDIKDIDKKFSVYKFWSSLSNWNNKTKVGNKNMKKSDYIKESFSVLVSNEEFFAEAFASKKRDKSLKSRSIKNFEQETAKIATKVIDKVIKNHKLPSVRFEPDKMGEAKPLSSFFYGVPRFIDGKIPMGKDGKQLRFMAQLNCKDLKNLPDFPTSGLLQFWVQGSKDLLKDDYKVIYIKDTSKNNIENVKLDMSLYKEENESGDFPFIRVKNYNGTDNLLLKAGVKENISPNITDLDVLYKIFSEEYEKMTGEKCDITKYVDYIWDDDRLQPAWGSRVGGYPGSTQEIPNKYRLDTVLLQLDSCNEAIWGDSGIAGFYISRDNLAKQNFKNVKFWWDCY